MEEKHIPEVKKLLKESTEIYYEIIKLFDEMNDVADYVVERLEKHGVTVYRNNPATGINAWIKDSNYYGVDCHIAIHSNASNNHNTYGVETWVNDPTSPALSLAHQVQKNLVAIYPYKDKENADRGVKYAYEALGEVNTGAISEYDRVNTRYTFLTSQKDDLNASINDLLSIINELDDTMKDKLTSTFNELNNEFGKVFKKLFKGGDASLILTNPEDILNTGLEIKAVPPGKDIKNTKLLSGGEATLTAISLLFAILNIRTVPFCILDEVEAALDEVNVDMFGSYLHTLDSKTQFIIITHKKRTMEYTNNLYGITMQESGVSKLVSVKLD